MHPKQVKLWLIKAQILEKQAYIEEARKTYEESIQINKSQHLLYTEFAFFEARQDNFSKARSFLKKFRFNLEANKAEIWLAKIRLEI